MFLWKTLFPSIHFKLLLLILYPNSLRTNINVSSTCGGAASLELLGGTTGEGCPGSFIFFLGRLLGKGGGPLSFRGAVILIENILFS